jgi:hypothetical protein
VLSGDPAADESVRTTGNRLYHDAPRLARDRIDAEQYTAPLRYEEGLHQYSHRTGLRLVTDLIGRSQHAAKRIEKLNPALR